MTAPLSTPTVAEVVAVMDRLYPPGLAEEWDAVGLVSGDPDAPVRRIVLAVDPTLEVAAEAVALEADLLITHHPLFLHGVHGVATNSPGGQVVSMLIRAGCALFAAHTNADAAAPGVNDALAAVLGVGDLQVLDPTTPNARTGIGRVGRLPEPEPLVEFAARVARTLPATHHGVRFAGPPNVPVQSVAMCSGAGDSLLAAAAESGADVYVTADLRHHRALDHLAAGGCALVDVSHWASEWPWCEWAAAALQVSLNAEFPHPATTVGVTVTVSTRPTDPWTGHVRSPR